MDPPPVPAHGISGGPCGPTRREELRDAGGSGPPCSAGGRRGAQAPPVSPSPRRTDPTVSCRAAVFSAARTRAYLNRLNL